jgi:hypothetical protein
MPQEMAEPSESNQNSFGISGKSSGQSAERLLMPLPTNAEHGSSAETTAIVRARSAGGSSRVRS